MNATTHARTLSSSVHLASTPSMVASKKRSRFLPGICTAMATWSHCDMVAALVPNVRNCRGKRIN